MDHRSDEERLRDIDKDVEKLWPLYRGTGFECLFDSLIYPFDIDVAFEGMDFGELQDHLRQLYKSPNLDDEYAILDCYTTCLRYMARYPHKKETAHFRNLGSVFDDHAKTIVPIISGILEYQQPRGRYPVVGAWVTAFTGYIRALLELANSEPADSEKAGHSIERERKRLELWDRVRDSEGLPPAMPPWPTKVMPVHQVQQLVLTTSFVEVCMHCLLLSKTPLARENSVRIRQLLNYSTEYDIDVVLEGYYTAANRRWQHTLFQNATAQFVDVEWQHEIIDEFLCSFAPYAQEKLFMNVFVLSTIILSKRSDTGSWVEAQNPPEPTAMAYVQQPNKVFETYLKRRFQSNPLELLKTVVLKHEAVELMSSHTIHFAAHFKPQNGHILRKADGQEIFVFELFLVPTLISTLHPVKKWTPGHAELASLLVDKLKNTWKNTLETLRRMLTGDGINDRLKRVVPWVVYQWVELGSLIGIHQLVNPNENGCFSPKCPFFMVESHKAMNRCPCRRVRYCDAECQNRDWKAHKPHCVIIVDEPNPT